MTLPFNEKVVNDNGINIESFKYPNFCGFLNPFGIPISFEDKYGYTGHGESPSVQEIFRVYYILNIENSELISPLEKYIMSRHYQQSEKERYIDYLKRLKSSLKERLEQWRKDYSGTFAIQQMELDIYSFLVNCYSAETFFAGVGKIETCKCEREFWATEYKRKDLYDLGDWDFNIEYRLYKDRILADIFKRVLIEYLGYHSVERVPKTIITSSSCIYETFYNYLLNDFTIFQIPKMVFDFEKRKYVQQSPNDFFIPDSELRLKDEIQSIKKLVPINERTKYYR